MISKEKLIECLREEADCYQDATDERGKAFREMNLALICEINSGRFDVESGELDE